MKTQDKLTQVIKLRLKKIGLLTKKDKLQLEIDRLDSQIFRLLVSK